MAAPEPHAQPAAPPPNLPASAAWSQGAGPARQLLDPWAAPEDGSQTPAHLDRFRIVRKVGEGGMGVVYEAFDEERNERVALKTLAWVEPSRLLCLKQEFRSLARVSHPNLVQIYELFSSEGRWFFSMDFVEGPSVAEGLAHWALEPAGELRLRKALRELAEGADALHTAGLLHLDLKPPNVLLSRTGSVAILDFGLVRRVSPRRGEASASIGTPGFMAPEQIAGEPVGPATDWYAFGVILFQLLTGKLPFGQGTATLDRGDDEPPPLASDLAPGLPPDLCLLCRDLLARQPAARPTGAQVLAALGAEASVATPRGSFVGRDPQLKALTETWVTTAAGGQACAWVTGPAGIGKTSLVERFLTEIEGEALVLRGRCFEREQAPFKGFDALIDDLAQALRVLYQYRRPYDWDTNLLAAAQLFPTLRGLVPSAGSHFSADTLDPAHRRVLAFRGLKAIFHWLAQHRRIVLYIDDIHWSDADSARLWSSLVAQPDPAPLFLIGCYRDDAAAASPFLNELRAQVEREGVSPKTVVLPVPPLSPGEAAALASTLLGRSAEETTGAVVSEAGGSPFLLEALSRRGAIANATGAVSVRDVVRDQYANLPERAIGLLNLVALCGRPTTLTLLGLVEGGVADSAASLLLLEASSLLRVGGLRGADRVDVYHARIRDAVVELLSEAERRELHTRIATRFAASGRAEAQVLAHHFYEAGLLPTASTYAEKAAAEAETTLAFARAAELYTNAAAWSDEGAERRSRLGAARARALYNSGRVLDAAEGWRIAAQDLELSHRAPLDLLAAEAAMLGGQVAQGQRLISPHLRRLALPVDRSPLRVGASVVTHLLWLLVRGTRLASPPASDPAATERADLSWSLGKGLAYVMPLEGLDWILRSLHLALSVGDAGRVARALPFLAAGAFYQVRPLRAASLRYLAQAETLAGGLADSSLSGSIAVWQGMVEIGPGHWAASEARLAVALEQIEARCAGMYWERTIAAGLLIWVKMRRGEFRDGWQLARLYQNDAAERGDLYSQVLFVQYVAYAEVARGELEVARSLVRWIGREWSPGSFTVPSFYCMLIEAVADLYEGNLTAARERWTAAQEPFRKAGGNQAPVSRIDNAVLEAQILLSGAHGGTHSRRLLVLARGLEAEHRCDGPALGAWLRAAASWSTGEPAPLERLRDAALKLQDAGLGMHSACLRHHLGRLSGDADIQTEAAGWLEARGAKDPGRWAAAFMPVGG